MSGPYGGYGNHPQNPNPQHGPPQRPGPSPRRAPSGRPAPKRGGRGLLVGAVVAAAVGVVAIVAGVLFAPHGGNGGSATSADSTTSVDSPQTVAQKYIDAGKQGDSATMLNLTCDKDKATVDTSSPGAGGEGGGGSVDYQILGVQQTGDTAVASVKITLAGTSTTKSMPLIMEHGGWKVCD